MAPTRRTLLVGIGAATVLSGCVGDADDADDDPAPDDDADDGADDAEPDEEADDDGEQDVDDDMDDDPPAATVEVASHPEYGDILVDGDGLTLYMFDADERGAGASECYGDCATNWPPLIAEDAVAGDGVTATLSTFDRDDGEAQVAAYGWPLYYWIGDDEPGDTNGQGVNDVWWVLAPDGTPIREVADDADDAADDDETADDEPDDDPDDEDQPADDDDDGTDDY